MGPKTDRMAIKAAVHLAKFLDAIKKIGIAANVKNAALNNLAQLKKPSPQCLVSLYTKRKMYDGSGESDIDIKRENMLYVYSSAKTSG
jgi:hypothetical protein